MIFFFKQTKKEEGGAAILDRAKNRIKMKCRWRFPLMHFRCQEQAALVEEPQIQNSPFQYSKCLGFQNIVEN